MIVSVGSKQRAHSCAHNMTVLVTGAAGFRLHLSTRLLGGARQWWVRQRESLLRPQLEAGTDRSAARHCPRTGTSFQLIGADLEDPQAVDVVLPDAEAPERWSISLLKLGFLLDREPCGLHTEQLGGLWPLLEAVATTG